MSGPTTTFLFLTDPQLGCYASFSGMSQEQADRLWREQQLRVRPSPPAEGFEWDASRFRAAIAVANRLRPDFVVIAGDMIDDARDEAQEAEFFEIARRLDPAIPLCWLPGNHDATFDGEHPTRDSLQRYRERFGADYYAFEHGGALFVALNTAVIQRPEAVPDEWDAQLTFLRRTLAGARAGATIILLGHHPLFTDSPDEADTYWNIPQQRRQTILDLVREHRVRHAFAGHWHRNAIARDGDFEMVTSGPVGYPLGDDPSGYRVVEVRDGAVTHSYRPLEE